MNIPKKEIILGATLSLSALFLGAALGRSCEAQKSKKEIDEQLNLLLNLENVRKDYENTVIVKNKEVTSLKEALDSKDSEIAAQADLILKLKNRPSEIKYIIKTQASFEPVVKEQKISVRDLPKEKVFGLNLPGTDGKKLVTDQLTSIDTDNDGIPDQVVFTSYAQSLQLDSIIAKESSSFLLRLKSDYDDIVYDIPLEASVVFVNDEKKKSIRPDIALQLSVFSGSKISNVDPVVGYDVGVSFPWLHPKESYDLLSPYASIGTSYSVFESETKTGLRGGLTIISYNIGWHKRSVIKDTWIGVGASIGTEGVLAGNLNVSTRL